MTEPSVQEKLDDGFQEASTSRNTDGNVSSDDEHLQDMCRVCRGDEGNLYYPCLCTGSIKYVHQECLVEWLKYSKKEVCELCNHKYSFQPIYRSDMPKALPLFEILTGIATSASRVMRAWILYTIVLVAWLGIVPITAARIYQAVFSGDLDTIFHLPITIFLSQNFFADIYKGIILLIVFICAFISLVWLREQIIHGGPQEWLVIDGAAEERRVRRRVPRAQNRRPPEALPVEPPPPHEPSIFEQILNEWDPPGPGRIRAPLPLQNEPEEQDSEDDYVTDEYYVSDEEREVAEEEELVPVEEDVDLANAVVNDDNNANANNNNVEQDDRWGDWDRLGDELTWQRLIGLDGSFIFIEHVFWVIALNTLFTVFFAFSPYKFGNLILNITGIRSKIAFFPSLTAILTGYLTISVCVFCLHTVCRTLKFRSLYRILGIVYLVLKVFLLVLVEIGFFPMLCGWWMDLCSLTLFQSTLSSRLASFAATPASSLFIHWMIGMIYVFYSASFVLLLREVLRPGVLWFMRNLNDPEFNPIMEMIELPVIRHLRRLVASISLFFMAILLIVYVPLRFIYKYVPRVLPYNLSLTADTPLSELSLELLILQIVLPALLEQTSARAAVKKMVKTWCRAVGYVLQLESYLLSDNYNNNNNNNNENENDDDEAQIDDDDGNEEQDAPEANQEQPMDAAPRIVVPDDDGILGNGGLAAEHQALLLLREPQTFEPYQKPSFFPLRIVALLIAVAFTATSCSIVSFIVPVSIGRYFVYAIAGSRNVHELYTISLGMYLCWCLFRLYQLVADWAGRGGAHFVSKVREFVKIGAKLLAVLIPACIIIPYLIGLSFEMLVVIPWRVALNQTPMYFLWQEWAMGVLHMKIIIATIMMGPEWWMRTALEQMYAQGLINMQVRFIYDQILMPVIMLLVMQMALPKAIVQTIVFAVDMPLEDAVRLERFSYPFTVAVVSVVAFLSWQISKLRALALHIRNEKYLVGTQLVNYERQDIDAATGRIQRFIQRIDAIRQ